MNYTAKSIAKGFFPLIFCWYGFTGDGAVNQIYIKKQIHGCACVKM